STTSNLLHQLFRYPRTPQLHPLSLHDALPISEAEVWAEQWITAWDPRSAPLAICPGARHFTKRWPEAHWLAVNKWCAERGIPRLDRKSTRLNSSHDQTSYAVFCLKKKN